MRMMTPAPYSVALDSSSDGIKGAGAATVVVAGEARG
jgi:hypothetical protein